MIDVEVTSIYLEGSKARCLESSGSGSLSNIELKQRIHQDSHGFPSVSLIGTFCQGELLDSVQLCSIQMSSNKVSYGSLGQHIFRGS